MIHKGKEYKLCIECKHCTKLMECERKEQVDLVDGKVYRFQCSTERSPSLDDAYDTNICGRDGKFWEAK